MPDNSTTNIDLSWIWNTAAAFGTGVVAWVFGGRVRERLSAKKSELDNIQQAIEIYRKAAEDLREETVQLRAEIKSLRGELDAADGRIKELTIQLQKALTI